MTPITFNLDSSDYTAKLTFEVLLNDSVMFTTEHVSEPTSITIAVSDDDAEHELKFVLKNKTHEHTKLNEAGDIASDAMLSISNIAFDDIKLGHMFFEQALYLHDMNGSQSMNQHKFYGNMGCNGYVSLKFSTPVYIWLLENM